MCFTETQVDLLCIIGCKLRQAVVRTTKLDGDAQNSTLPSRRNPLIDSHRNVCAIFMDIHVWQIQHKSTRQRDCTTYTSHVQSGKRWH